ncbi:MAG: glycosyltransferase, partial [Anaerolineae bacterium]
APSTPLMRHYTRWTLRVAAALHADCRRDVRLAGEWGFGAGKPTLVVPGSGGVRTTLFYPPARGLEEPVVVNPRGVRAYVRNDVFFRAIPRVLEEFPQARFLCADMADSPHARRWVEKEGVASAVELLPHLSSSQMAELYRRARVLVSPSVHDGTPNSLLEGMACGCLPVAGDLESLREWIVPGENGLLVDPTDPQALAEAMRRALRDDALYRRAREHNVALIRRRAEYDRCMEQAEAFYRRLLA